MHPPGLGGPPRHHVPGAIDFASRYTEQRQDQRVHSWHRFPDSALDFADPAEVETRRGEPIDGLSIPVRDRPHLIPGRTRVWLDTAAASCQTADAASTAGSSR